MTVPGWNAHVKVVNATDVGLGWSVPDDVRGSPLDYAADIALALPQGAGSTTIVADKQNETVVVNRDARLGCGPNGVEAVATYRVSSKTGTGSQVLVQVCKNAGQKPIPANAILGQAAGQIGQEITVHVVIPGACV